MFCVRCGKQLRDNDTFCSSCGVSVSGVPLMPPRNRLAGHLRLLGILWLALSAFRILPGFFLLFVFHRGFPHMGGVPFYIHGLMQTIGLLMIVGGVAGIAAGIGLLTRQSWARLLTILLGGVSLIDMPLGTALGIYTLWVLLPGASGQEYARMSRAA